MLSFRTSRQLLWLITLLIIAGLAGTPLSALASSATVAFVPANGQVVLNQTMDVAVQVQDVTGLYGVDIAFTFDPAFVEVVDAYPATGGLQVALGTFLDVGFVFVNTVDNGTGAARFAMTQLNPSQAKNGTGALIVVRLRGKQTGVSPLTLTSVQLAGRDGTRISATLLSGVVEVVNTGSGSTATALPTQGEGTLMPSPTGPTASPRDTSTPAPTSASPTPGVTAMPSKTQTAPPAPPSVSRTSSPEATVLPSSTGGSPLPSTLEATPTIPSDANFPLVTQESTVSPEEGQFPRRPEILVGLGILAALIVFGLTGIVWRWRKRQVVHSSQPGEK
jgi:hypothetical protein